MPNLWVGGCVRACAIACGVQALLSTEMLSRFLLIGAEFTNSWLPAHHVQALLSTEMEPLIRISQDELDDPKDNWEVPPSAPEACPWLPVAVRARVRACVSALPCALTLNRCGEVLSIFSGPHMSLQQGVSLW